MAARYTSKESIRWFLAISLALGFHVLLYWLNQSRAQAPRGGRQASNEVALELVPLRKQPIPENRGVVSSAAPVTAAGAESAQHKRVSPRRTGVGHGRGRVASDAHRIGTDHPAVSAEVAESAVESGGPAMPGIDAAKQEGADLEDVAIWPTNSSLAGIAAEDPQIRRLAEKAELDPFDFKPKLRKTNLPQELKHNQIGELISVSWNPDWSQIKTSIARGMLGNWLKNWQSSVRKGMGSGPPAQNDNDPLSEGLNAYTPEPLTNSFTVIVEASPLSDGTWAVSVVKSSGHPFFDRQALADAAKAAELFPPWEKGYGGAVRFAMSADFIVIPPVPAVGLSWGSIDDIEFIYPLKRMIHKRVHFLGYIES